MNDDTVRILVSTDNHLGYAERDPVRGNDSLAAFEEVLRTAIRKKADFILLAGDIFHENKPSRRTLHSAMELLRKYCLGGEPVYIEILNDQSEVFKTSLGTVNYQDPFQSVHLPVFAIHGNHDDPSREGGMGDALAALDLFAITNLINYFGKSDRVEDVEVTPVLIRKGKTKIALYGLGAMRDERLNRMWNQKKVKFVRLTVEQGRDEFYNIFVLHQNRDYGRGKKNCVHESMIPEWMDLVIWGNEHECMPHLAESLVGTYRIFQPGSSVACSLSYGESSSCPKHMGLVEVLERKYRMKPIRYQQVRSFVYGEIVLREIPSLDPSDHKIEEKIKVILGKKVNEMIKEARALVTELIDNGNDIAGLPPAKFHVSDPLKVLVRLKVDHEGFQAINHQRFGSQFVGEVANPSEIFLFSKKRKELFRAAGAQDGGDQGGAALASAQGELRQLIAEGAEDEIHKIKIDDLVNETLASSKSSLFLLSESEMAQALDDYIIKKLPTAIQDIVAESLERTQRLIAANRGAEDRQAILKAAEAAKIDIERQISKGTENPASRGRAATALPTTDGPFVSRAKPSAAADEVPNSSAKDKKKGTKKNNQVVDIDMDMDFDMDEPETSSRPSAAKNKRESPVRKSSRAAAQTKKKTSYKESDEDEEEEEEDVNFERSDYSDKDEDDVSDDFGDEDEDDEDYSRVKAKRGGRGGKRTAATAVTAKKGAAKASKEKEKVSSLGNSKRTATSTAAVVLADRDEFIDAEIVEAPAAPSGVKKRALPLSFSQKSSTANSATSKAKPKARAANNWDDED